MNDYTPTKTGARSTIIEMLEALKADDSDRYWKAWEILNAMHTGLRGFRWSRADDLRNPDYAKASHEDTSTDSFPFTEKSKQIQEWLDSLAESWERRAAEIDRDKYSEGQDYREAQTWRNAAGELRAEMEFEIKFGISQRRSLP